MYTNSTVIDHKHVGTVIPLEAGEMQSCKHKGMLLEMDCRQLPHGDHIVHYDENHPDIPYEIRLCGICDGSIEQ